MNRSKNQSMKPRNRARTSGLGGEISTARSQVVYGFPPTTSTGVARNYFSIEPLNGACNNNLISSIAGNYEFYRVKSAEVRFVPAGGDNAVGSIVCAVIMSPELMKSYKDSGTADKDNILYTEQGCEVFSVAHGGVKRMVTNRQGSRTWYSVNNAIDNTINEYDRCVAAMFVVHHNYTALTIVPGNYQWNIVYEFKGIGRTSTYTFTVSNGGDYVVPYYSTDSFPKRVLLRKREGEEETYQVPPAPLPKPEPSCEAIL